MLCYKSMETYAYAILTSAYIYSMNSIPRVEVFVHVARHSHAHHISGFAVQSFKDGGIVYVSEVEPERSSAS